MEVDPDWAGKDILFIVPVEKNYSSDTLRAT